MQIFEGLKQQNIFDALFCIDFSRQKIFFSRPIVGQTKLMPDFCQPLFVIYFLHLMVICVVFEI